MKNFIPSTVVLASLLSCSNVNDELEHSQETPDENSPRNTVALESEELCPIGAEYDEADDFCFIECDGLSDEECEVLEEEVFGNFDEFYVDDYNGNRSDDGSESVAQYVIESNLTLSELENADPGSDALFREIWRDTKRILPTPWLAKSFSEFHINTDGEDGTLAYVQLDEYQPGQWVIAFDDLDYAGINDKEFVHTVIHEFAHIVFLNENQVSANTVLNESQGAAKNFVNDCPNFSIDEGCTNSHSYINRFYQTYWTDIFEENAATDADEDLLLGFYEKYKDRFVSEYAATDPIEDAAEVFTHFVLRDKPKKPVSIVDKKISFMHTIEPLVKLRNQIRIKLSAIQGR